MQLTVLCGLTAAVGGLATAADSDAGLELAKSPAGPEAPIAVIVHGIHPTEGELTPLAHNIAGRGFRTYLFRYASADRLDVSARRLGEALRRLAQDTGASGVVVVGYSMGGLIARRALTADHEAELDELPVRFDLITIASPHGGFGSANWSWLSFGFGPDSYRDLGTRSRFIREPGDLATNVRHAKIETVEDGARRLEDGRWVADDVVGLENQVHALVDRQAARVNRLHVGHTNVVNVYGNVHPLLVGLLDQVLPEASPAASADASGAGEVSPPPAAKAVTDRAPALVAP